MLPVIKELEGEGVGEFKISDLVHTFGEFLKHCLSKIKEENTVGQGFRKICR